MSRTAEFEQLARDLADVETLIDPATDAPVVRRDDGSLLAAVPQRLPAMSPLAEIILDHPIWVRTADGTLYLAPKGPVTDPEREDFDHPVFCLLVAALDVWPARQLLCCIGWSGLFANRCSTS